jgi:two-component sensor histidine kinase
MVIFISMIIFSLTTAFLAPAYLLVVLVSLLAIGGVVVTILKTQRYELAAKLFLILGCIISSAGLFLIQDMIHIVDLIWYLSIVIFGYFVLGKKWGLFGLIAFSVSLAIYMFFMLEVNILKLQETTFFIRLFQAVNAILASIVLAYILHHFIQTNRYAELKLQGVNEDLKKKNNIIKTQNDLNVVMLKEIHHRVKNNLQVISSLLRLQSTEVKNEESKQYFTDSINRISTMALIHEKLYQTDLVNVNVISYFESLTKELKSTYPDNEVNLSVELDLVIKQLNLNTLVPLALLYNELFSNTIKHAFKEQPKGEIHVGLREIDHVNLEFKYADNGKWESSRSDNSFGLEMIETFTEQLEGTYERSIENGTSYIFKLKILK